MADLTWAAAWVTILNSGLVEKDVGKGRDVGPASGDDSPSLTHGAQTGDDQDLRLAQAGALGAGAAEQQEGKEDGKAGAPME